MFEEVRENFMESMNERMRIIDANVPFFESSVDPDIVCKNILEQRVSILSMVEGSIRGYGIYMSPGVYSAVARMTDKIGKLTVPCSPRACFGEGEEVRTFMYGIETFSSDKLKEGKYIIIKKEDVDIFESIEIIKDVSGTIGRR